MENGILVDSKNYISIISKDFLVEILDFFKNIFLKTQKCSYFRNFQL